jgi:hypothetical protein
MLGSCCPGAVPANRAFRGFASRVLRLVPQALSDLRERLTFVLPNALPRRTRRVDELEAQDVAALVADLFEKGKAPGTIRKTVQAVAMVLDHAGVKPNPARDRRRRQASARGAGGDKPADRRSRRRRLSTASGASPARAPVPRLERRARRGDRPHARRGLRRDATSRPASRFDDEGAAGALDRPPGRPRGRARGDASASPLPRSGGAPVRGQRSGRAEDGDREGVSRGRRSDVLASRPPPSAD